MNVPIWVWLATLTGFAVVIIGDLYLAGRRPHTVGFKEAGLWVAFYVTLAVLFGAGIFAFGGAARGSEFFAGYITEYSLSIDNLFVFVIIMARFAVPALHQNKVLLIGIAISLVLRGLCIAAGSAAISAFNWTFYIFGALLIYTAIKLALQDDDDEGGDFHDSVVVRGMQRVLPTTSRYHGSKLTTKVDGRRMFTPMVVVVMVIGIANVVFALDSIPAIFGLTQDPFIVFSANAFALMGLRQLYFLIGDLLTRLVYLSYGLSAILGFIGIKLIIEALDGSGVHEVGSVHLPHIGIVFSLGFIVVTLTITTIASLLKVRLDPESVKSTGEVPAEKERVS